MHICLISPSFPPMVDGGVAISTGRLVERFLRAGYRVTVLTTPPNSPENSGCGSPFNREHLALCYDFVEDPLHSQPAVANLCDSFQVRQQQDPFDVILAYFVYPGGYLATILGERLRLPVVCSCRGNDITKDMFIDPSTIATVLQRSTHLIFVSNSLLRMADTLVPCRAKATFVANAVDCSMFVPAADSRVKSTVESAQPTVVGTSGILRWKKGIPLFLDLIRQLCVSPEVRILIAGYSWFADDEQQIAAFLRDFELTDRVEITGPLPHPEMCRALQRMDIYVSTSYQEGMPNGVLEAMACGLPVVATDADGTPELVEDGVTGYLCRMGDLETLAAGCHRLIEQPVLRQCMGKAGRQRVQQYFHPDQEAAAIAEILHQVCAEFPKA